MPQSRMNSRHFAALLADRVCRGCNTEGLEDGRGWRGRSEVLNAKFITPTFSPSSFALFVLRVYPPLSILRLLHKHRCYVASNSVFVTFKTARNQGKLVCIVSKSYVTRTKSVSVTRDYANYYEDDLILYRD